MQLYRSLQRPIRLYALHASMRSRHHVGASCPAGHSHKSDKESRFMSDAIVTRPILRGTELLLRPPLPGDKQDRLAYGRDSEFRKMVGGNWQTSPPLTDEEVEAWYQEVCQDPLCWIIAWRGRCVGIARLHTLDEHNRRARYAIGLFSPQHRGRGIGTEATRF